MNPETVLNPKRLCAAALLLSTFNPQLSTAFAQGTAFTYQGRLSDTGTAANGVYDFMFRIFDAPAGGTPQGIAILVEDLGVTNGLFTVTIDAGANVFTGAPRWLDIGVRPGASTALFTNLTPRQPITAAPYALHAANAAGLMSFTGAPLDIKVNGERVLRLEITGSGPNIIGGASVNGVAPGVVGATISGGGTSSPEFEATNRVEANYGTIGGGSANTIQTRSQDSTISGGAANAIQADSGWSTIGGGEVNTVEANARYSTISGGGLNKAGGYGSAIAGGSLNSVRTNAEHSSIGGGLRNEIGANAMFGTIAGGSDNTNFFQGIYGTIGGGRQNAIGSQNVASGPAEASTIGGGWLNRARGNYATIGGGYGNQTSGDNSTVAGGTQNSALGWGATVGGGAGNLSFDFCATVGGGQYNTSKVSSATVSGGRFNTSGEIGATIGGGIDNVASGLTATVPGGWLNTAGGHYSFAAGWRARSLHSGTFVWADATLGPIGVGEDFASSSSNQFLVRARGGVGINTNDPAGAALNVAGAVRATSFEGAGAGFTLGTLDNQPLEFKVNGARALRLEPTPLGASASGAPNVIGGAASNFVGATVFGATIAGGGAAELSGVAHPNRVTGNFGTVSGGRDNLSSELGATVGGGIDNVSSGVAATVSGGIDNRSSGHWATVGGGETNQSVGSYATVSGGSANTSWGNYATVGGGQRNNSSGDWATVNGGRLNTSGGPDATVAGGHFNTSSGDGATVGGGGGNTSSGGAATIGGGAGNTSSTNFATVGGGYVNASSGEYAAIGGGSVNQASGVAAVVGGGWGNIGGNFSATVPGGHSNIAGGRYSFGAGQRARALHDGAFVWADSLTADAPSPLPFASTGSNEFSVRATGGVRFVSAVELTNGAATAGVTLAQGGGSWTSVSDRNAKENFEPVKARAVLDKVATLPLSTWNYRSQTSRVRHIGPMAQDFKAAFDVGESDTGITTVDADGVALAAIQGLNQKVEEQRAELERKQAEITKLRQRLDKLEQLINSKKGGAP